MGARLIPGGPGQGPLQLVLPDGPAEADGVALVQAAAASARLGNQLDNSGSATPVELVAGTWLLTLQIGRAHV